MTTKTDTERLVELKISKLDAMEISRFTHRQANKYLEECHKFLNRYDLPISTQANLLLACIGAVPGIYMTPLSEEEKIECIEYLTPIILSFPKPKKPSEVA